MNRVSQIKLMLALLCASFLLMSAHQRANAAPEPIDVFTSYGSTTDPLMTLGAYDFDLFNRTNGWVLNGFYTKQEGKWSKNWLSGKIQPGEKIHMRWSAESDSGACVVPFKVTWDDYDKPENYSVDWCKGIKAIYLKDNTFTVSYK